MVTKIPREEVRRLKARGLIDVGASCLPITGFEKRLQWNLWDDDED